MSHVVVFPTAHPAASVPSGLKNIDVVNPKDWKTSNTLVPRINLRYGTESFFLERKIVKINKEEPTKDKEPVTMVKIVNVELSVDDIVYSVTGFVRIRSLVVLFVVFLVTETKGVVALLEFAFVEKMIRSTVHGERETSIRREDNLLLFRVAISGREAEKMDPHRVFIHFRRPQS